MHRIALAAAIALIALTAAGCATAPTSPPPAAHATAAATTQPAAPVATPNKAAAVLTWYAGQGGRDMTKLGTAVSFASAASTGNPATEVAACQAIAKAVTAAQACRCRSRQPSAGTGTPWPTMRGERLTARRGTSGSEHASSSSETTTSAASSRRSRTCRRPGSEPRLSNGLQAIEVRCYPIPLWRP